MTRESKDSGKGRKRNVKCPSYADDLTLTLVGSPSVCLAFEIIERFSEAHGGGRVVSASGSETSVWSSTPTSAIIYDAYSSIIKKKKKKKKDFLRQLD